MFSFRTTFLLFLFVLIAIVGSTNGGCDEDSLSQARQEMSDAQSRRYEESMDRMGRITLSCETTGTGTGGGSSGNSGLEMIIEFSVGLFFLIWIVVGIWIACVCRQKAINAATINPYPGAMGAKDGVTTNAMSATTGKPSNGDNNV